MVAIPNLTNHTREYTYTGAFHLLGAEVMKISYFMICAMLLANIAYADQQENWISRWYQGIQSAKNREFIKSIDEYTKANGYH